MDPERGDEEGAQRPCDADPDAASRRRGLVAFAVLAAAFVVGSATTFDPDFDVTFGIEAWRRFGPVAAAGAAAVVGLLIASRRAADAVADGAVAAVRPIPRRMRLPLLCAAALTLFIVFPDVSLSGDLLDAVRRTIMRNVQPSNAATCWLHFAATDVVAAFGFGPVFGVRAVSFGAGVVGVACGVALARSLFDDGPRRTAASFLLLTTGGAALFFGSVEVYAPLVAAVLLYLLVCVRAARGAGSPLLPPLVLGLAVSLHGSALLLAPSLAFLAWNASGDGGRDRRRAALRVAVAGALVLVPIAATVAGLWFGTWRGAPPSAGPARWGNFFGAQGNGPFLAWRLGPTDIGPRYAFLDAEHALAALTTVFVAAPAAWAVLAARGRAAATDVPSTDGRLAWFAVAALAPWIVYPCIWNVSYSLRSDWDMFSPLGAVAAFAAAVFALRARLDRAAAVRIAAICLFSFAPFVVSHAGDFRDRRTFATVAAAVIDRARVAGDDEARAEQVRRWNERSRLLDESGAAARIDEGIALGARGRLDAAAAKFGEAVAAEPDNRVALLRLGTTNLRLGRRDEARRELVEALSFEYEHLRVHARRELGRMAFADGDFEEAARQFTRSLRECSWNSEAPSAARDLAETWRRLGRADLAVSIDRWAAERSPQ